MLVRQFEHQARLVGEHPGQHPVLAESHDRQGECLDVVIRLRPSTFQLVGDVGEKDRVLAVDDGGDQIVTIGEAAVDGGATDTGATGYVVEGYPAEAVLLEFDDGGVEDRAGGRVDGAEGYPRA